MRWRKADRAQHARTETVIDLRERLAPYVGEDEAVEAPAFEPVVAPVAPPPAAAAPGPYRPRHLAT